MFNQNWRLLLPNLQFMLAGALTGAAVGCALYFTFLSSSTAVAIVQTVILPIEHKQGSILLVEKLQTVETAKAIAETLGDPGLAKQLPARQYGGEGKLRAREISSASLIEIRVTLRDGEMATRVAGAAAKIAVDQDSKVFNSLQIIDADYQGALAYQIERAKKILVSTAPNSIQAANGTAINQENIYKLNSELMRHKIAMIESMAYKPGIFANPNITRPIISNLWVAVLAAAMAGCAIGYAVGLMQRR